MGSLLSSHCTPCLSPMPNPRLHYLFQFFSDSQKVLFINHYNIRSSSVNIKMSKYPCVFILNKWGDSVVIEVPTSCKSIKRIQLPMNNLCHPIMPFSISPLDKLRTFTDNMQHSFLSVPTHSTFLASCSTIALCLVKKPDPLLPTTGLLFHY